MERFEENGELKVKKKKFKKYKPKKEKILTAEDIYFREALLALV
jgi:hypothetical protein